MHPGADVKGVVPADYLPDQQGGQPEGKGDDHLLHAAVHRPVYPGKQRGRSRHAPHGFPSEQPHQGVVQVVVEIRLLSQCNDHLHQDEAGNILYAQPGKQRNVLEQHGDARENHRQQAPQPQSRQNLPDHVGGGPLQLEEVRVKVPAQIGGAQPQHKAVEGHVKQVGQVGRAACEKKRGQIDQQEHRMVQQAVLWQCFHVPLPPQIAGLHQNFVDLRQRIRRTGINQRVTPEQHQIVHAVRHYGEHLTAAREGGLVAFPRPGLQVRGRLIGYLVIHQVHRFIVGVAIAFHPTAALCPGDGLGELVPVDPSIGQGYVRRFVPLFLQNLRKMYRVRRFRPSGGRAASKDIQDRQKDAHRHGGASRRFSQVRPAVCPLRLVLFPELLRRSGVQGMDSPVECAPGGQNQVDGKQDAVAGHGEGHPVRAGIHPGQEVHGRHAGEDRRHVHPHKADGLFRVGAVLVEEVDVVPPVPLSSNGRRTDAGGGFFEFHIGHPGQMHGLLGHPVGAEQVDRHQENGKQDTDRLGIHDRSRLSYAKIIKKAALKVKAFSRSGTYRSFQKKRQKAVPFLTQLFAVLGR